MSPTPIAALASYFLVLTQRVIETIYVYGLGLISEETSDGGRSSNYRVYHYDYRGSTTFLTGENGKVTDSFIYGPYGELLRHSGDTQTIFMYNGKYGVVTDENGLYYMRARYYNPQIKRFINIDPIKDSYNWFAFVEGDPVRFIDPWGLVKIKVNGNEVDAIDIMDDGKLWANPLSLAKAAGFDISNVGNIVRITSGDNYVHLSGVAYVDEQQQTHYFHTTGASYNTTIHNDHFTGKLTVQGSLVDAKAFIMHLNCSLVGAIDWGEGNGEYTAEELKKLQSTSVYLSPSFQPWNKGAGDYGTEMERMGQIADILLLELENLGITVYRSDEAWARSTYTSAHINDIVKDSNSKKPTVHIALHSNAFGGTTRGIEVLTKPDGSSDDLAESILSELMTIAPDTNGWNRGFYSSDKFGELKSVKSPSVIIEYAAHDNIDDAKWIMDNINDLGKLTAQGIVK